MPRHLISDAHEWSNEIPTVPTGCLANLQPRERAWEAQRGKKTLLSLTLARPMWPCLCRSEVGYLQDHWHVAADASLAWWGVWLGRHACYTTTQASKGGLRGEGNHP